jgi:hypothetical protein
VKLFIAPLYVRSCRRTSPKLLDRAHRADVEGTTAASPEYALAYRMLR